MYINIEGVAKIQIILSCQIQDTISCKIHHDFIGYYDERKNSAN